MAFPRRSAEQIAEVVAAFQTHGTISNTARALGLTHTTVARYLKDADKPAPPPVDAEFEIDPLPDEELPTDELLALRCRQFVKRSEAKEAKRLIPVRVKVAGPFGVALFGDPHVDDDGTNIVALRQHVDVVKRTEGLLAGNVGDTTNNWIGRLARLYGEQGTSAKQAWQLAEWLIRSLQWLYIIGGNHDAWSGAGDPLKWIGKQGNSLYQMNGVRLSLNTPSGRSVLLNARHQFRGNSQWNAAHAVSKAVQLGSHDHIVTAGHIHSSGYQVLRDPATRRISHAIQVASYKTYDKYADAHGFPDQNIFVCPVAIIRPAYDDTDPRFVQVLFDPESGADYLTWLRKRKSERG